MKNLYVVVLMVFLFVVPGCRHPSQNAESELKAPQESHDASSHVSQPKQAKAPQKGRIIVPGGLKEKKLNKLWEIAKTKCLDLHYTVTNEDKNAGNIVCAYAKDSGQDLMAINFDKQGFMVSVQGNLNEMPIIDSMTKKELSKNKKQMEDALKKAAGISK